MGKVKCVECAFLTIWHDTITAGIQLWEAHDHYRKTGELANQVNSTHTCDPLCLVGEADLRIERANTFREIRTVNDQFNFNDSILAVIQTERECNGFTSWLQGFSPKEHRERLLQEEQREAERRHAERNFRVALGAVGVSVLGVLVGAGITYYSAALQAEATDRSTQKQIEALERTTKLQIEAQKDLAKTSPAPTK